MTRNAIVIDVPRAAVGSPKSGTRLFSVGSYTLVGGPDNTVTLETLPITVDSTPTFDVRLPGKAGHARAAAAAVGGWSLTGWSLPLTVTGLALLVTAATRTRRRPAALPAT